MRLGEGELTMHYRRDGQRRIECGVLHGCITAVPEDVTCGQCVTVMEAAKTLAEACGCRNEALHSPVARAQHAQTKNVVPPREDAGRE